MEQLKIENWTKGLISRLPADKIVDNAFSDCCNIDLGQNYLPKSIKGKIKVNGTLLDNASCMGITVYNSKESGSFLIVACGGYLWYSPLNRDNFQKYKINNGGTLEDVQIDPNVRVRFAQYNDRIFVFTGKYPVIENTGINACILVIHNTAVGYLNRDNYYGWLNNGTVFYTLSATPTVGDAIFSDLYRTKITATVASVSTNTFTDSDNKTYTRTSSADNTGNNVPQGLKIGFIHQERLFGLGSIEDDNGIYWSQPYDPARWTPVYGLNYDTVGRDDGENITGGASFGGIYIYIFKAHNVYRYVTNGDIDQWGSIKVDTTYGAVAHETIRLFDGNLTYLSLDGVAQLNGNTAVLIDEQIQDKTTNISVNTDVQIERNYLKNDNWENAGATTDGIVTLLPEGIRRITNAVYRNEYGRWTSYESVGSLLQITDSVLKRNSIWDFESTTPRDGTVRLYRITNTGSESIINSFCFKIEAKPYQRTLSKISVFVDSKSTQNATNRYLYLTLKSGSYSGTVVATSDSKEYDSIVTGDYNTFTFNNVTLAANTTYWFCGNGTAQAVGSSGYQWSVTLASYYCAGDGYNARNGELFNASPLLKYICSPEDKYEYKSSEIDYGSKGFSINSLTVSPDGSYSDFEIKISVANYPTSVEHWNDIDNSYITTYTITNFNSSINLNITNAHRYLRYKIEFIKGIAGIEWFIFWTHGTYNYISEPIQINPVNPVAWGISEFTRIERGFYSGVATVYMRSGTEQNISEQTFYEIQDGQQIPADIGLNMFVQFKVVFPELCDNVVNNLKITYYTSEKITKVCAIVFKDKYRLNIPENKQSSNNTIECIYDKAGYWVIKDNESNFDYCKSNDDLFAASQNNGQIYKKETSYANCETEFTSYFVTKKFTLSDFENLFRKFKTRYISTGNVTVGISVDDKPYVNYVLTQKINLYEVIKTLTGIVRGQSIKLRFSWTANDTTEIHGLVLYWQILRQLNRG